jgi:AmmeMemoRadiSam system protein A
MLQLSSLQKQSLLEIARRSVEARLREGSVPFDVEVAFQSEKCGVFVSIHRQGELRGCIGRVESDDVLPLTTAECAVSAAFDDPRFVPMCLEELEEATFEVSVLSPLQRIDDVGNVEVGRHGLMIEKQDRRGLLLPQVAVTYGWDRIEFLRQTSIKAGLDPDAWQESVAEVSIFEAIVFEEDVP